MRARQEALETKAAVYLRCTDIARAEVLCMAMLGLLVCV